jgi:hypothetical protein
MALEQIDLDSWVDFVIINEMSKNIDAYMLSTFIYTPDIGKEKPTFFLGPVWDFNIAFGLSETKEGYLPGGLVLQNENVPFYWDFIYNHPDFQKLLKERYSQYRAGSFSDKNLENTIDSLAQLIRQPAKRNFRYFPLFKLTKPFPNYYMGKDHEEELEYLRDYLKKRLNYLDNIWLQEQ